MINDDHINTTTTIKVKTAESEQLESTKPTINQQLKPKKGCSPTIGTSERITKVEFESLNDEVKKKQTNTRFFSF